MQTSESKGRIMKELWKDYGDCKPWCWKVSAIAFIVSTTVIFSVLCILIQSFIAILGFIIWEQPSLINLLIIRLSLLVAAIFGFFFSLTMYMDELKDKNNV